MISNAISKDINPYKLILIISKFLSNGES